MRLYGFRPFEERGIARPILNELAHWGFDGDLGRRADVVDQDDGRVIRRVGWIRCLRCSRPHWSDDVVAIRLCWCCGGLGSDPVGPKLDSILDIRQRSPRPERAQPGLAREARRLPVRGRGRRMPLTSQQPSQGRPSREHARRTMACASSALRQSFSVNPGRVMARDPVLG